MTTITKVIASLAFLALLAAPASARMDDDGGRSAYPQFGAEGPGYWQTPNTYVNRP